MGCRFLEFGQDVAFQVALMPPNSGGREVWSDSFTPSVHGIHESLSVDCWCNATAFLVYLLHDSVVFTTGSTLTRAVRTLVVRVVKAVGHSILNLQTSLLKPPLCHWASLCLWKRRCSRGWYHGVCTLFAFTARESVQTLANQRRFRFNQWERPLRPSEGRPWMDLRSRERVLEPTPHST